MHRLTLIIAALAALASTPAMAEIYYVRQPASTNVACYEKVHVPALVQVNTRAKLLRPARTYYVDTGDRIVKRRDVAVYKQSRRVVEDAHVTLVKVSCDPPPAPAAAPQRPLSIVPIWHVWWQHHR